MESVRVTAADGFELTVQISGRPDGRTVLLLAGQANSHRWWTSLREDFEDAFRVVTLDQRGTGASRGVVTDWSTELFADDARDVLAALGVPASLVYGGSLNSNGSSIQRAGLTRRAIATSSATRR
jgi:pimeloyl-ACP methyl ester carboxylesterase